MRIPLIIGNWKMNTTVAQATTLVGDMLDGLDRVKGVHKVLCPPFVSLAAVGDLLKGSSVMLGAQDMCAKTKGAYTGEISPLMLAELCQFVILGHSERRQYFGETDQIVNAKVISALKHGLRPIFCIGEKLEEHEAGMTEEVVARQLAEGLSAITGSTGIVIAYEPVWAIGTGKAASGEQAVATIGFIRDTLARLWTNEIACNLAILYGGSVTGDNIAEFVSYAEIDGALVGGASLRAEEFVHIAEQTAIIAKASH